MKICGVPILMGMVTGPLATMVTRVPSGINSYSSRNVRIEQGDVSFVQSWNSWISAGSASPGSSPGRRELVVSFLAPSKICCILGQLTKNQNQSAEFQVLWRASSSLIAALISSNSLWLIKPRSSSPRFASWIFG